MKISKLIPALAVFALLLTGCTLTITPEEASSAPPRQTEPGRPIVTAPAPTPSAPQVVPNFAHNQLYEYSCDGGRLLVRYTSNESAQVFHTGAWQSLTRTVNMDGHFVYRDDSYSWYARGNTGYLELNGVVNAANCRI